MHHIRPTDPTVNSTHNNNPYGIVSGGKYVQTASVNGKITTECKIGGGVFEPADNKKGDTARIIFYLLTRYSEADSKPITNVATSMEMLLEWNDLDPVDQLEINRNNAVQQIQGNRNPFIDNSEYADLIWGDGKAQETNYYNFNVQYDSSACTVSVVSDKVQSGKVAGNVTINVSPKEGYNYIGIKDTSTGQIVSTSTQYVINNVSKDYNLQVVTESDNEPKEFTSQTTKASILVDYTIGGVMEEQSESYRFTSSMFTSENTAKLGNLSWTFAYNGNYKGYDETKGFQIGSAKNSASQVTFTSESLQNVKTVIVEASGGSSVSANLQVSVGGVQKGSSAKLTSTNTAYTFTSNDLLDGQIVIKYTQTSSKALYIKSITVIYEEGTEGYIMTEAGMRFGTCITKELYDSLGGDEVLWGVEYCVSNTPNWNGSGVRQEICEPARVAYSGASVEDVNGDYYQFALVFTNLQYKHIDTYISARVFVFDGDNIYYMQSTTYSLRELANTYLNLNDTSSFEEHLDILRHIKNYK